MKPQQYITDKLVPEGLPVICAPRLELMGLYRKASEKRCVYVHAPAGCGKTTSTLLWAKKSGLRTVWIGLDPYDNAPAGFYRVFCTALFSAVPSDDSLIELVKKPEFGVSPVEYTIEILSRLSFEDCAYALIFDDFHHIRNEEIIRSLLFVLKRLPLSVTTVILSRGELPQAFSSRRESGKIALIGAAELAFTSDEIRWHYADYGRLVSEEEAEEAFALTEGWAIAVSVLIMGGSSAGDENGPGSSSLHEYIKTQIWDKLEGDLKSFLMMTSSVDRLSVQLCEHLTGRSGTLRILQRLVEDNMFLSRRDEEYVYHHLFLDFLREQTKKEASIRLPELYRKAADWYMCSGEPFNALRYYLKCENTAGMADALWSFLKSGAHASAEMSKIHFLCKLPAGFLHQHPCLYVGCAWCAFLFGGADSLFNYLDKLHERLGDILTLKKEFLETVIFLYTVDPRYTFKQQMARLQTVGPVHANTSNVPKSLSHNLPYFHRTYRDLSHFALDTEEHFAEFRLVYRPMLGSHYPLIEEGIRSGLLYDQNRPSEALSLVERHPVTDSKELVFLSKMQTAACLYAMGRGEEAARCRRETEDLLRTTNLFHLMPVFNAYETKLKLLDGDRAAAKDWLSGYFITESGGIELQRIFIHFTTVRAYILMGEYTKARSLCERLRALCEGYRRLLDAAEAAVLLCVVLRLCGEVRQAADLLRATLLRMQPYGYIRVFADEGTALLPLLKKVMNSSADNRPEDLCRSYMHEVCLAVTIQSRLFRGIACAAGLKPVKLSARQRYVLELLAKGCHNAEIVERSGLSINTVRYHTKALYQKLDVTSAADAVLRARELQLIR